MKAIERLYKYLDYKGIKPTNFEREIGLSNGYFSIQKKRKADIGESTLKKITEYCQDLNPTWLLTGEGSMLVDGINLKNFEEISHALSWLACSVYGKKHNISFDQNSFATLSDKFKQLSELIYKLQIMLNGEISTFILSQTNSNPNLGENGEFIIPDVDHIIDKYIPKYVELIKIFNEGLNVIENSTRSK